LFDDHSTHIDPDRSIAMRQFVLVEQRPRSTPRSFALSPGTHFIGRAETCHINLAENDISRRHATISVVDGTVELADLGSRNGTFVDDRKVKCLAVISGQVIRFGATAFLLKSIEPHAHGLDTEDTKSRRHIEASKGPDSAKVLTAAQKCVYDFLLKGLKDKEIAKKLRIRASTVHTHVREIFKKLGVHSRPELLARRLDSNTKPGGI
jgi:pSer/pThr/pTyr-binding forkhead associated (FHA) protein